MHSRKETSEAYGWEVEDAARVGEEVRMEEDAGPDASRV